MDAPFLKFQEWFEEAKKSDEREPTAMSLATVDVDNRPSVRMVLLKGFDERGFVFYTNESSRKGRELVFKRDVALCFFWASIDKQIRIEGQVERVSNKEADEYFASRARISQLGAWASKQSSTLESVIELERRLAKYEDKFRVGAIPRPPFWGGYRVHARSIEFWSKGEFRLHDRELFQKKDGQWVHSLLYP
jgi:pyridoxamine 5'-phosphate oxidase